MDERTKIAMEAYKMMYASEETQVEEVEQLDEFFGLGQKKPEQKPAQKPKPTGGLINRGLEQRNQMLQQAGASGRYGFERNSYEPEGEMVDENRRMARDPEGRRSGHSKQPDPSKPGFTGIGNMSIDQIAKMSARIDKDKEKTKKEEFDIFDTILDYLVSEGYADTNENALVIMANMSEEWKESILDESRGAELRAKHGDNPSKKLETKAFGKAMRYDNRDRLPTGTGTEVRGRYLGLSGRARSRAGGETPASSAVGPDGKSRTVKSRGGRSRGTGAGENRDRPTG